MRSACALWSKPPKRASALSSERSPAWPNGGWPRSCASASASARRSSAPTARGTGAGNLRHLQRVGQPRAVMIALVVDKHLRLVCQPPECGGMDDAVAVAPERVARRACRLDVTSAPALCRIGGINGSCAPGFDRHRKIDLLDVRT